METETLALPAFTVMEQTLKRSKRGLLEIIRLNVALWRSAFWCTWDPLPLATKLTWIAFIGQTLAILTLIELFFLKK